MIIHFLVGELKKKWTSLRNYYKRLQKKRNEEKSKATRSGAGTEAGEAVDDITWPFYNEMRFLDDSLLTRCTISNQG